MSERLPDPLVAGFPTLSARFVRVLGTGTVMGRVHWTAGPYPCAWNELRAWGPTNSRFDPHPEPPALHEEHAVAYASVRHDVPDRPPVPLLEACLAECFQDTGVIAYSRNDPYFSLFRTTGPLTLLDVTDTDWVHLAGGNSALTSGPRDQARKWARAIFAQYGSDIDGIWYGLSTIPSARGAALWASSRSVLPTRPADSRPLADPALRAEIEAYAVERRLGLEP